MPSTRSNNFFSNFDKFSTKSSKLALILFFVVLFLAMWNYVQTEVLTLTADIDGQTICENPNKQISDTKYYKIINYDGGVGKAELICIRQILDQSTFHKASLVQTDFGRQQTWEINYTQDIYKDSGLFWPLYI